MAYCRQCHGLHYLSVGYFRSSTPRYVPFGESGSGIRDWGLGRDVRGSGPARSQPRWKCIDEGGGRNAKARLPGMPLDFVSRLWNPWLQTGRKSIAFGIVSFCGIIRLSGSHSLWRAFRFALKTFQPLVGDRMIFYFLVSRSGPIRIQTHATELQVLYALLGPLGSSSAQHRLTPEIDL